MSDSDSPKLYSQKPKKAQLKQFRGQPKSKDFSSPPVMGTQTAPSPPPPPQPKEPFIRRYKFLWPMLLAVNLGLGAKTVTAKTLEPNIVTAVNCTIVQQLSHVPRIWKAMWNPNPTRLRWRDGYAKTNTKKTGAEEEEKDATPISVKDTTTAPVTEASVSLPPTANPVIKREPIPENQQRELFKWILEEKRKIKPKDAEEKRRIDEEKALLKNLIKSKSIPSI
ncbi:hypothetical protein A2U01_0000185 [Trifolium medium]|uniref:Uncharacterized protein n=1 Tax=Trifolium medium TaxID=97028 RepID=A0A392LWX7_9FABA|nr:hypothetical protein [Trifolium medium]